MTNRVTSRSLVGVAGFEPSASSSRTGDQGDGVRTAASTKPRLGVAVSGVPGDVLHGKIVVTIHWISS